MFRNERELADRVERLLREEGYEVRREVSLAGRIRLDILAVKDDTRRAIEVKFTPRGLRDDIVKAQAIARLPEVDEVFVCAPSVFMSEDVRTLAESRGVGLLAADSESITWLAKSRRLKPARLSIGGSHASLLEAGAEATYQAVVSNSGEKAAVDVELFLVLADPFLTLRGAKSRARKPMLDGDGKWAVPLKCRVKAAAAPGRYALLISCTAKNAPRDNMTVTWEVKEPNH